MKKLIPILLAVFALVSCEKDPDMDKLDNEYLVFTSHDTSTKFNDFSTYYIPDSILIIGDKKDPEYWKDENAQIIINAFKTKMNAAGYTAANKDDADLGLQVSYVASTYYFHGYYNDGPWWGYYPGYWYPGTDPGMEEPAGFPWFWVIGGVVVVAAGVFVYLKLRKNKKESVDEDEDI